MAMDTNSYLLRRIEILEEELASLKRAILKKGAKRPAQIRGIWKGVDFSDEEIEKVKASWAKE